MEKSENLEDIETGVDKLVVLVKSRKKVTVKEAAKMLGVPEDVIKEWADLLENEGVLHTDYSLTSQYLVYKELSEEKKQQVVNDFLHRKENFLRKAQTTSLAMEVESENIQKIKNAFKKLELEVDFEVKDLQLNFDKIRKFEEDERDLKKKIAEQYNSFINKLRSIDAKIKKQEEIYNKILAEIKQKSDQANKEERILNEILDEEYELSMKLEGLKRKSQDSAEKEVFGEPAKQLEEKAPLEVKYVERLLQYVKESFKKGFTLSQIEKRLRSSGWTEDQVAFIMKKAKND